jgi:4-hydroxybenzoate polyprenyltransferase
MPTATASSPAATAKAPATAADYLALARVDHWPKHVFIIPGIALAMVLHGRGLGEVALPILIGFASAFLIASANYVLNEWLDARTDAFHPSKSKRPAVTKRMSPAIVFAEYLVLAAAGLAIARLVSSLFLATAGLFLLSGLIYNVPPLRTKDRPYLDVLSESLNNPIRLTLGWAMVDSVTLPPSSLLIAYWMGGAFLMAMKRVAEYRAVAELGALDDLALYRRSFAHTHDKALLVSASLYAQMAAFFLAVFVVKYRIEYLLALPVVAALFAAYLRVALKPDSTAQAPEKLFRERTLMGLAVLLVAVLALLTWIDLPWLEKLSSPHYIRLD